MIFLSAPSTRDAMENTHEKGGRIEEKDQPVAFWKGTG